MRVYVFFWFDVEDYITPESDVALGRLVDLFDRHGLKGTFKMVGEKVRGLERRGHYEILAKLRAHDIGYHTDYHSKPPTISEYMLQQDWSGGILEFMRREQEGFDTLTQAYRRIPSCYGQPGGSWAPQVYPALRRWGIPVYLDAGPWVELNGRPHRYCDILDMLGLDSIMSIGISRGPGEVQQRQARLAEIVERLRPSGGEISLYAHECEFVTQGFWDALNYARGKDTPHDQWVPAPLIAEEESEARYEAMDGFLGFVQSLPDVEVVVASQAPALYLDSAKARAFTPEQIGKMCANAAEAVTHQECEGAWLSPAELFGLAVSLLAARVRNGEWPDHVPYRYLDGPPEPAVPEVVSKALPLDDIYGTCLYEDAYLDAYRQLPAHVQVGRNGLAPASFLATIGAALPGWLKGGSEDAPIVGGRFIQGSHVPSSTSWDWVIFPPDFDGDALLEMGKLQAWTLKPAPLRG